MQPEPADQGLRSLFRAVNRRATDCRGLGDPPKAAPTRSSEARLLRWRRAATRLDAMAARPRHRPEKTAAARSTEPWQPDPWLHSVPVPEATEGGDSGWEMFQEASRRMDLAFAPTQPSDHAPLAGVPARDAPAAHAVRSADELMVIARRNNRVSPRQVAWLDIYQALGGDRYEDLPPPPVQPWLWSKLSNLQKRLHFREHIDWAERHGKLALLAARMEALAESDWLHMGD